VSVPDRAPYTGSVSQLEPVTTVLIYGVTVLAGLVDFSGPAAEPILAAAVLAVAAMVGAKLTVAPRPAAGFRVRVPVAALRERSRPRSVPRLCDPDARGRCRPRAPSAYPLAA
jgi:hypothetical protein